LPLELLLRIRFYNDMFSAMYNKPSVIRINGGGGEEAWLEN